MNEKQLEKAIKELEGKEKNTRFERLVSICTKAFGEPKVVGSHHIFKMPWPGDPRINIQSAQGGKAKSYQVTQVIEALKKLADTSEA
jgi:hypothetical protein